MFIYVDADACPVIKQIETMGKKYHIPVILISDTNHSLHSDYSKIITIGAGKDAVDFAIVSRCKRGDIVVTQDYGVAAMILSKGEYGIHQSGRIYTDETIDQMLMERHLAGQARRKKVSWKKS